VYIATIQIGSKNKEFTGIIDTSSADFWVPMAGCQDDGCRTTLGPQDSSTLQINQSNTWSSTYWAIKTENIATGGVEGMMASDNYTIAGLQVNRTVGQFGLATDVNYGITLDVLSRPMAVLILVL
jgi:Eukaryotic aspartyl protease